MCNIIVGSCPGMGIITTVGCSLSYPEGKLCVISEVWNYWCRTWYQCFIFSGISRSNIGWKLNFRYHGLALWNCVGENTWTCTGNQRWNFFLLICWCVDPNPRFIFRSIDQWNDTGFHFCITYEYNNGHKNWVLTGCFWNNCEKSILWIYWLIYIFTESWKVRGGGINCQETWKWSWKSMEENIVTYYGLVLGRSEGGIRIWLVSKIVTDDGIVVGSRLDLTVVNVVGSLVCAMLGVNFGC